MISAIGTPNLCTDSQYNKEEPPLNSHQRLAITAFVNMFLSTAVATAFVYLLTREALVGIIPLFLLVMPVIGATWNKLRKGAK